MTDSYENYLDVRELRLIEALYSTRSVTKAAEIMGQNQPIVSTWLKRIREKLNDPLFVRTSEGMAPTQRAEAVVATAREILEAMNQIVEAPHFDPGTSTRTFRMIVPDGAQTTLLPNLLSALFASAPLANFEAISLEKNAPHLLESGEADLAFGGFVPVMEAGFYEQTLFDQGYVCLVSAKHPRIKDQLTLDEFQQESHIAFGYGRSFATIESEMQKRKIKRHVRVYLPGVLGVVKIVAATDMITTLPGQIGTQLGHSSPAVRLFPCPVPMPRVIVKQFWHSRYHLDPGNQWLRALCAKEAREGMKQLFESDAPEDRASSIE